MRTYFIHTALVILAALIPVVMTGCGGAASDAPELASLSGKVTLDGTPLASGEVVFQPVSGRPARADIVDGVIQNPTTLSKGDGVPLGELKMTVFSSKPDPSDASGMAVISLIPKKYNDVSSSGLSCSVNAGEQNEITIELSAK